MFVKPAPGLAFRDPVTKIRVPAEGIEVPDGDLHWARLIQDGDAVVVDSLEPPAPPSPPAASAPDPAQPAAAEVSSARAGKKPE